MIVTDGWRKQGDDTIEEEMIYFDKKDETYEGGGVGIVKKSDTGKMLVGAEFAIKDSDGNIVKTLVTNDAGVSLPATGGPGTSLIYIIGLTLTGIAGTVLLMRRLKRA